MTLSPTICRILDKLFHSSKCQSLGFDIRELLILKMMKPKKKYSKSREEEEGRDKKDKNWKVEEMRRKGCDN